MNLLGAPVSQYDVYYFGCKILEFGTFVIGIFPNLNAVIILPPTGTL